MTAVRERIRAWYKERYFAWWGEAVLYLLTVWACVAVIVWQAIRLAELLA